MNKTAELVNHWADFEEKHPEGSIEDFCRYFFIKGRQNEVGQNLFSGDFPPRADIVLTKLIDRISRLHMIYVQMALKEMEINHFEEFRLMTAIANLESPKKTEVIYHTINELSTGLALLAGMKKQGYIIERGDPEDKRSKRLQLTAKGQKVLQACYEEFGKIPLMLFDGMPEEDVELCIQLLKNVDIKYSQLWQMHKRGTFGEVYRNIKGR
jgi:DNA-binding MarR family transcriptional regulator